MAARLVAVLAASAMVSVASAISMSNEDEEAAMRRMLTLHHRSLVSNIPLPIQPLPGMEATPAKEANDTCAAVAAGDTYGYPTSISPWAARFAVQEHQLSTASKAHADGYERLFSATTQALHDSRFADARKRLHALCLHGQAHAHALRAPQRKPSAETADAGMVENWVQDCSTLLQYMPQTAPTPEDHKRLFMLLHDLGGSLLLLYLLGGLSTPLLPARPLADLANNLGNSFGEWNRKTALTRALSQAEEGDTSSAFSAVTLLRENKLCEPPGAPGAAANDDGDMWVQVGVRACAVLLLRSGRVGEALDVLRMLVPPAPTMHPFLSAFELASRLPPPRATMQRFEELPKPKPASGESAAMSGALPPVRFGLEHMLEILEAALLEPQHGLASEGQLLKLHLTTMLRWGQSSPPTLPLKCDPPAQQPLLRTPRVVVVMPFVGSEKQRLISALGSWRDGGGLEPCALSAPRGEASGAAGGGTVDLLLYSAGRPDEEGGGWLTPAEKLLQGADRCFRRVRTRYANLTAAEQYYIGGWDNTGPNNLFYRLFLDRTFQKEYDVMMWMETDVAPVAPHWLERVLEEAAAPRSFWRKGPAQQPRLSHPMVSTHHYHMNSAGLYRLNQPCFVALMRRVADEYPRMPHDVSTHLFLHDPRHFHIWQAHAHRFLYTDFVQNRLDPWDLEAVRAVSPDTVLVHGKLRKEAGRGG